MRPPARWISTSMGSWTMELLRGTIPSSQYNQDLDVYLGRKSGRGNYFNGIIDQVRIYNRALSAAEIQTDMNTPIVP